MGFAVKEQSGFPVIELEGEYWGTKETETAVAAVRAVIESGRPKLVLNLHKLVHMNSTAIGAFVGLHVSAKNRGGAIVAACLEHSRVRNIFAVVHLDSVFRPCPTVDEAIAILKMV